MKTTTLNQQTICLTNGIIWNGYQPAVNPEECDPLWVLWQHWQHTAALERAWKHEAAAGSERDDQIFETRVANGEFTGSIQS